MYTNDKDNSISEAALNAVECLQTVDVLDDKPTLDELRSAVGARTAGKAPGKDGIPSEVIKCAKATLLHELHDTLCLCWREGKVPQDMRDASIVTLYKEIGDNSDCNNYRGISLLSIVAHSSLELS